MFASTSCGRLFGLALILAVALAWPVSALAGAGQKTPAQVVEALYRPYLRDPHAQGPITQSDYDLILPFASRSLRAAIEADKACAAKEGMCAHEADIIINGQDWDLADFRTTVDPPNGETQGILASFTNCGTKNTVRYDFVMEDGAWKLDEVTARRLKPDGKPEFTTKLKQGIRDALKAFGGK